MKWPASFACASSTFTRATVISRLVAIEAGHFI
jgi:hypothetical protein